jgi:ketosteroid isomerase-like protein
VARSPVDTLREAVAALNRGDVDGLLAVISPEMVFIAARSEMEGTYVGHEGMRRFMASTVEALEVYEIHHTEVREIDGRVLALGSIHFRGRGGHVDSESPSAAIGDFDEQGRLKRWEEFRDRGLALEALGLSD